MREQMEKMLLTVNSLLCHYNYNGDQ